jgi:hypothetical protein
MTLAMPSTQTLPDPSTPDALLTALELMFTFPDDAPRTLYPIHGGGNDAIHIGAGNFPIRPEFDCE